MGRRDQERCVGGRSLVELTGDPRCSRRYRSVVIFMCSLSHPCPVWKGVSMCGVGRGEVTWVGGPLEQPGARPCRSR